MMQVLNRNMDPRGDGRAATGTELTLLTLPSLHGLVPAAAAAALPPQLITAGRRRDCVRMRGLPYEASVNDIVTFLGDHSRQIVTHGVHLIYNAEVLSLNASVYRHAIGPTDTRKIVWQFFF